MKCKALGLAAGVCAAAGVLGTAAPALADLGNTATNSIGAVQVGSGSNSASNSVGTVQVSSVSVHPSARVHAGAARATITAPASVGSGTNHATSSVGTVQVSSVSVHPIVRVRAGAARAAAGVPASVGSGTNNATGSIGTAQIGGGNTATDSLGTVQVSHIRITPFGSLALAGRRVLLGLPLAIGGTDGNTSAGSAGTVQAGGGNTASGSVGTVQASGSRSGGGSSPATPPSAPPTGTTSGSSGSGAEGHSRDGFLPPKARALSGAGGSGVTHLSSVPATLPFTGADLGRGLVAGLTALLLGFMLRRRRSATTA